MIPKSCDVKDCLDDSTQVLVMHHCEISKTMESSNQSRGKKGLFLRGKVKIRL